MSPTIAIVTLEGDLHANLVQLELERCFGVGCAIVPADHLAAVGGLSWSTDHGSPAALPCEDGGRVLVADIDLVWWRRCHGRPTVPDGVTDPAMRELVVKDTRAALLGTLLAAPHPVWVSDPAATRRAQNKLLQLQTAQAAGLRVPRTLVSSDPPAIRDFVASLGGRAVAKTLTGLLGTALEAGVVELASLTDDAELALAPTIYQEEIRGTRHLRVCVFGSAVYGAVLESARLDWRLSGDLTATPTDIDPGLGRQLRAVLDALDLRMGVFDVKLTPEGEPVWLEVNPQGQFLFLEGLCGLPLTRLMAEFLVGELAGVPVSA